VSRIGEEDVQEVVGVLLQALWHSVIFASDASTSRALVRFCLDQMEGRTP
jgi:hypothetical protein